MPSIKRPGLRKSEKADDEKTEDVPDKDVSFQPESEPAVKVVSEEKVRNDTLNKIMAVTRNPSTIFKPPFGTNVGEHHCRLGEHARRLWMYNKITDLVVKLRGTDYPCHKTVLSCYSKYFKELLLDQKGAVNVIHLKLPSVTTTAFEVLLTYMYTSDLNLTCQNIGEVYTASRKLGIDGALILCTRILTGKSKYDVHSVYVYVTAKKQRLFDCAAKALKIMTKKFELIVGTPEFLDLDFKQVREYLSQDVLATRSEVIVYLAALKWISVKFLEREEHAPALIACVRFQMMTLNEVLACFSPPLLPGLLEQKSINDTLLGATCYVAAATVNEERRFERFACRPRRYLLRREPIILWDPSIFDPDRHAMYLEEMAATTIQAAYRGYKTRKSIEADKAAGLLKEPEIGRSLKSNLAGLDEFEPPRDDEDESYIQRSESGSRFPFLENIRKSIVSLMSAEEDEKTEESRKRYSYEEEQLTRDEEEQLTRNEEDESSKFEDDSFEEFSSTHTFTGLRRTSSMNTLANHVNDLAENTEIKKYISSSAVDMNSDTYQKSIQKPETIHKIYMKPSRELDEKSSDLGRSSTSASDVTKIPSEVSAGYILVTGGFSAKEDALDGKRMFLYDLTKDKWKWFDTMEKARHHHCLVLLNEEVYFIGGCTPENTKTKRVIPERACYKYNIKSRKWSKIKKMRNSRIYHGVVEMDGKIYAIGGKNDKDRFLDSVEIYNPASNKWTESEASLRTPTMGAAACVHDGKLWVVGGMVQENDGTINALNEVKYYDPEKKRWNRDLGQLPFPRAFSTIVSFENEVYIIGGTTKPEGAEEETFTSVSDVLYYHSKEKRWLPAVHLPSPRHFVNAHVIGSDLYVLGGLVSTEEATIDEVISYNKKTDEWRSHIPVPELVCAFASASLPKDLIQ